MQRNAYTPVFLNYAEKMLLAELLWQLIGAEYSQFGPSEHLSELEEIVGRLGLKPEVH